jgi:hypothetical protein
MPDINIFKNFSFSPKFQKAFDKGEIDKLYRNMYRTAESIAVVETRLYISQKSLEAQEKEFGIGGKTEDNSTFIMSKIADYRNERIKCINY